MIICVPSHTSSHACTHTHLQTHPSLPVVLPGTSVHWHRWWLEKERYRDRHRERERQQLIPWVYIHFYSSKPLNPYIFIHKSHVYAPYIYLPAIHPPIPPFSPVSPFITRCLHLSIKALSTVLELPPTVIHPFNPPIRQSAPQPRSYLVSWPFIHLLTSEIWPLIHPSHSPHPSIYPPIPSFVSSHQGKDVSLLSHPLTGSIAILILTSCMPQMKAKVHLPLQHPMVSSSFSPVIHVVKKLWVTPKSPAGPSKLPPPQRKPREDRLAGWLAGSPDRGAHWPGPKRTERSPSTRWSSGEMKDYYFIQMEELLTG